MSHPDPSGRFEVRVTSDSHFSWLRTRLSLERTLMAWVRTAISLIGFGFTIVQFFERFAGMEGVAAATHVNAPRYLGLALIGAGIAGAAIAIFQYNNAVTYLWSTDFRPIAGVARKRMAVPSVFVAVIVLLIGLFAFGSVALRYV